MIGNIYIGFCPRNCEGMALRTGDFVKKDTLIIRELKRKRIVLLSEQFKTMVEITELSGIVTLIDAEYKADNLAATSGRSLILMRTRVL